MQFDLIKEFENSHFSKYDEDEMNKLSKRLFDRSYINFLKKFNGGSILENSLNFYGVLPNPLELEFFYNNHLFGKYYGDLFPNVLVFAEDIFGNQFAFLENNKIGFINIETACIDDTFENFEYFISNFSSSPDYFSGFSIANKWIAKNGEIHPSQRLSPIKPFVIGGSYDLENLHLLEKESLFAYTSFLAKQIKDLPDGTNITLSLG